LTEVNNEITEFVRLFSKKRSLTIEETAEIKADVVKWFNEVMAKATLASSAEIKNIVNNYSEKRGVGERE
jgi:hypothetical protein